MELFAQKIQNTFDIVGIAAYVKQGDDSEITITVNFGETVYAITKMRSLWTAKCLHGKQRNPVQPVLKTHDVTFDNLSRALIHIEIDKLIDMSQESQRLASVQAVMFQKKMEFMMTQKFKTDRNYTFEEIERTAEYRATRRTNDGISVIDTSDGGGWTQYDFKATEKGMFKLSAIDGESIKNP